MPNVPPRARLSLPRVLAQEGPQMSAPPPDMVEVTMDAFFAAVGHRDVHPRCRPDQSDWCLRGGRLVGVSTPGYLLLGNPNAPRHYYLPKDPQ